MSTWLLGNRYEVGELLGRGGMADVHLGRDTRLGRVVAIKLLRTDLARDPTFQARFHREAQSAALLNHPAIVAVYDTGEETESEAGGGTVLLPYIVMEYVEGRTLRDLLSGSPMDVDRALEVTAGVLSALEYSHRGGIVHRDIKPANVMLTPAGDVKVMDYGIARAIFNASSGETEAIIGTAQYLSPEQARGESVDNRSDLYSTGCLLYELITGRPPFVGDSPVAVAYQHVREQPQPPSTYNPAVPADVDRIVMHALSKEPGARYQTAGAFRDAIGAIGIGYRIAAPQPGVIGPAFPLAADRLIEQGAADADPGESARRSHYEATRANRTGVFISYRRADDAKHAAGRLHGHLTQERPSVETFLDVDTIPLGVDFRDVIVRYLDRSVLILVMIGRGWLQKRQKLWNAQSRLFDPDDYVRFEIEFALKSGIPILPVLVEDAQMPSTRAMPGSMHGLVRRSGVRLRHDSFGADAFRIIQLLDELLDEPRKA